VRYKTLNRQRNHELLVSCNALILGGEVNCRFELGSAAVVRYSAQIIFLKN
jgi:hypothetical protein